MVELGQGGGGGVGSPSYHLLSGKETIFMLYVVCTIFTWEEGSNRAHCSLVTLKPVRGVNYKYIRALITVSVTLKQLRMIPLILWADLGDWTQYQGRGCCLMILEYPMPGQAAVTHSSSCCSPKHQLLQVNTLLPTQPVTGPEGESAEESTCPCLSQPPSASAILAQTHCDQCLNLVVSIAKWHS